MNRKNVSHFLGHSESHTVKTILLCNFGVGWAGLGWAGVGGGSANFTPSSPLGATLFVCFEEAMDLLESSSMALVKDMWVALQEEAKKAQEAAGDRISVSIPHPSNPAHLNPCSPCSHYAGTTGSCTVP